MSFTHTNSLNRYGIAPLIVATDPANGSHTTLASALAAATSGQTVFLRDSVTEDVTLPTNINIASWDSASDNTPSITGLITLAGGATTINTLSGIRLVTNGNYFLFVTGTSSVKINLNNCYLDCADENGILSSNSNADSVLNIWNCKGDIAADGIRYFFHSGAGKIDVRFSNLSNSGGSTTQNSISAGVFNMYDSTMDARLTYSGTSAGTIQNCNMLLAPINRICIDCGGTATYIRNSSFSSGTASTISVTTQAIIENIITNTSNANPISGSGTVEYTNIQHQGTGYNVSTTTQVGLKNSTGLTLSKLQPAFLVEAATQSNVTGDSSNYLLLWTGTEVFDQNGDFASPYFTAPVTGRYQFNLTLICNGVTSAHTGTIQNFVTSNRSTYYAWKGPASNTANVASFGFSTLTDMDAGDTASIQCLISGSTKTCSINLNSKFSGNLVC